jgi:hypothetical protein
VFKAGPPFSTSIATGSAKLLTPFSPLRVVETWMRCSRCSTQASCSVPIVVPCLMAHRGLFVVHGQWRKARSVSRGLSILPDGCL